VLANRGAQPGDALLLTKALGTGVISTSIKHGKAEPAWIEAAVRSMTTLNKAAAEVITGTDNSLSSRASASSRSEQARVEGPLPSDHRPPFAVHALTDITGFGLIGHAREMALASGISLRLRASAVPLLTGALECVRAGYIPGGLKANREFVECLVGYEDGIPDDLRTMLFDPQTAGGLLISVAPQDAADLQRALAAAGVAAARIGEVLPSAKPLIQVSR